MRHEIEIVNKWADLIEAVQTDQHLYCSQELSYLIKSLFKMHLTNNTSLLVSLNP